MKKSLVLIGALVVFAGLTSYSATYYVSPSGSDTNNGTSEATPWKTVGKVNGVAFVAGDIIRFQGGQTFSGTALNPKNGVNGVSGNPVIFTTYGTGKATIAYTGGNACDISGHNYITVTT